MRNSLLFLFLLIVSLPLTAGESKEVAAIRVYYNKILEEIKNGTLYQREIRLEHPIIPGVGPTFSKIRIHYDMPSNREETRDNRIIRVDSYYQHTSKAYYEEYLYQPNGDLAFYYGRRGVGDIMSEKIDWTYEERFYYHHGKVIRIMYDRMVIDTPTAEDIKKAGIRNRQARALFTHHSRISFPQPVLFGSE